MEIILPSDITNDMAKLSLTQEHIIYMIKMYIKQLKNIDECRQNSINDSESDNEDEGETELDTQENESQKMFKSIQSMFKQEMKDKFNTFEKSIVSVEKSITTAKYESLKCYSEHKTNITQTMSEINKLSNHFSKGTQKGQIAEEQIEVTLAKMIPHMEINDTSKKGHQMDKHLIIDDIEILLEIKNLQTNVSKNDIIKFQNDMKTNSNIKYFILFSIKSGISNVKESLSFGNSGNQTFIYISNGGFECISLFFAIKFICIIDENSKNKEFDCSNLEKIQCFINQEFESIKNLKNMYDKTYNSRNSYLEKQQNMLSKEKKQNELYYEDFMKEIDNSIRRFDKYINQGEIEPQFSLGNTHKELDDMDIPDLKNLLSKFGIKFKSSYSKNELKTLYLNYNEKKLINNKTENESEDKSGDESEDESDDDSGDESGNQRDLIDFNTQLDSLGSRKKPYQDILDKYDIEYRESYSVKQLKELIKKNRIDKKIIL